MPNAASMLKIRNFDIILQDDVKITNVYQNAALN